MKHITWSYLDGHLAAHDEVDTRICSWPAEQELGLGLVSILNAQPMLSRRLAGAFLPDSESESDQRMSSFTQLR